MNSQASLKLRYDLAMDRIELILTEDEIPQPYTDYFKKVASFIIQMKELHSLLESGQVEHYDLDQLQELNQSLYEDIIGEAYNGSYANPEFACRTFGKEIGQLLCYIYTEIRGMIVYVYEKRLFDITILLELFLEVYSYIYDVDTDLFQGIHSSIHYFIHDYSDIIMKNRIAEQLDPSYDFATKIIMESELCQPNYLYQFGEYITNNEIETSCYLSSLSEDEIMTIARTYTEGFRKGFIVNKIDFSKKKVVNIRYSLGFERIVKAAILQFKDMGLDVTIYRAGVSSLTRKQHLKIGFASLGPNKQYDYDHRFDEAIYLNKEIMSKKLVNLRVAYDEYKDLASQFAGPACIEIFGEKPFEPLIKDEAIYLDEKQQQLSVEYQREASLIINEYLKSDEYSFTIIAFPIPDIGADFDKIFHDTVQVNTLDVQLYETVQQTLIDVLDQGDYVAIEGANGNRTNMKVKLHVLEHPERETNFENCLADVNIPVGEVFTSPQLTGTEGTLHVSEVYLNELRYVDLELQFKDGMIVDYSCKNFDDEFDNKNFVKENLLYHRETLPIGEFAIGTNTTAYAMGKKYQISHLLPILIAEKTGPHFAVGDTCYKMSEDLVTMNPDGKVIVAKDNECSMKRKTKIEEAYFNCHTDITIPYNELGHIIVHKRDGSQVTLIKHGRFVLPGTEVLNKALD